MFGEQDRLVPIDLFTVNMEQKNIKIETGVTKIYSCLVAPGKLDPKAAKVLGAEIPLNSRQMYKMLGDIFEKAEDECKIPISFMMKEDGKQENSVRDEIIALLKTPSNSNCLFLAERLQKVTTQKSGLGLLFFTLGTNKNGAPKIVISRFPADIGVLADLGNSGLTVQYVEKVFMKNAYTYKSSIYQGVSYDRDWWDGFAIDRQTGNTGNLANYWISDFLQSDFKITPEAGTKQLALALRATSATKNKKIQNEVFSAAQLATNLNGQLISVNEFMEKFSLSKETQEVLMKNLSNKNLINNSFKFNSKEFSKHIKYSSKELDSGVILTAPSGEFTKFFTSKEIPNSDGEMEFYTKGKVVNERLKNVKP